MRRFRALFRTMPTSEKIDRRAAERLIAGDPPAGAGDHAKLRRLLAAARAAARPQELAGERAAVAAFVRARQEAAWESARAGRHRSFAPPRRRLALVKAATAMSLTLLAGTALAAETGMLPDGMQQQAYDLFSTVGVPAPATGRPGGNGQDGNGSTPGVGRSGTPHPGTAALIELCQAWRAAEKDPHGKAMPTDKLRALSAAAGNVESIPAFCTRLLDASAAPGGPDDPSKRNNDNGRPAHPSASVRK